MNTKTTSQRAPFARGLQRFLPIAAPLVLGVVLGVGTLAAVTTWAENTELDTGPRVFPYEGVIDLDGAPYEGALDLQVTLLNGGDETWTEAHEDVAVSEGGRFGLQVGGPSRGVPAWVFDAEEVYVALAVRRGDSETAHTPLAGRQRIRPVPFAYWAAEAHELDVASEAYVEGSATAGVARVHQLNLAGGARDLNFTGPLTLPHGAGGGVRIGQQMTITHELRDARPTLVVRSPAGSVQSFRVDGAEVLSLSSGGTTLNGHLPIGADRTLDVDGTFRVTGRQLDTHPNPEECGTLAALDSTPRYFRSVPEVYSLPREDGEQSMSLGSAARRFCGLQRMSASKDDFIRCRLSVVNGNWQLVGLEATCQTTCTTW